MEHKDSYRYAPVRPNPAALALGHFPESVPRTEHPHFKLEEQAQTWLKKNPPPEHVRYDNGVTYGPNHEQVKWPTVQMIYSVEPKEHKLRELETNAEIVIDPSAVKERYTKVNRDVLYTKDIELDDAVPLDQKLDNEEIQQLIQHRGEALMRFQQMLERSGERERELVDMNDPEVAKSIRDAYAIGGLVNRNKDDMNLAERTMQHVAQDIAEKAGARTVIQLSAIQAKFSELLENQDPSIPEAERVSVAMSGTLSAFAAQVPSRDAGIVRNLQATIRGTVDELNAEMQSQDISKHEIGAKPSEIQQGEPDEHDEPDDDAHDEYNEGTPGGHD